MTTKHTPTPWKITMLTPAEQAIQAASDAYRLKHYGTLKVDAFGRKPLTASEIQQIRETKNRAPVSIETMLMKVGF